MVLWQFGELPISQIAARLTLPGHALTPMVSRLESAGLVTRRGADRDRRVVLVALTPAGAGLETAAARVQRTVVRHTGLSPSDLARLREQLHALAQNVGRQFGDSDEEQAP